MTFDRSTRRRCSRSAIALCISIAPAIGRAEPPTAPTSPRFPAAPRSLTLPRVAVPAPEPDSASVGAGPNPFGGKAVAPSVAAGQALTAPVTVNANTSADALTVTQAGAGRAISGAVTNASSALSAVKGITSGNGSGVNGVHSGTGGQAGKFEITNASSKQPSLLVTTTGTGSGVQAIVKSTAEVDTPAVLGQHTGLRGYGIGVEGDGANVGVQGVSTVDGVGVYGTTAGGGTGVYGVDPDTGTGVGGASDKGFGVYAYSFSGTGLYASSGGAYAGYFVGAVYASGSITAASYGYTSDRDLKQDFAAVDSADVLSRIAAMPITAWDYKAKPSERHIGPMAQDFHAAFGLGADEKHIDVVDGIGVSLAAIKELQRQLQDRDALVASLNAQVQALREAVDARFAALEQAASTSASTAAHP